MAPNRVHQAAPGDQPLFVVTVAAVGRATLGNQSELTRLARQLTEAMQAALAATAPFSPRRAAKRRREKLLLSKREAATLLGVGRNRTLHELVKRGLLKTVKVNERTLVTRASVEHLAAVGFDVTGREPARMGRSQSQLQRGKDLQAAIMRLQL